MKTFWKISFVTALLEWILFYNVYILYYKVSIVLLPLGIIWSIIFIFCFFKFKTSEK